MEKNGTIYFKVEIDSKEAQEELNRLNTRIESLRNALGTATQKIYFFKLMLGMTKDVVEHTTEKVEELQKELEALQKEAAYAKEELVNAAWLQENIEKQQTVKKALEEQLVILQQQMKEMESLSEQMENCAKDANETKNNLEKQKEKAGEVAKSMQVSAKQGNKMSSIAQKVGKMFANLGKKIRGFAKDKLLVPMLMRIGTALGNWMKSVIKTDDESVSAFSKLKGALLTMVQPLANIIIPAFTAFANLATRVIYAVAQSLSSLFGTTIQDSAAAAEALYAETNAIEGTGDAAKEAAKNLSGLDEISTWQGSGSGNTSSGSNAIAPDFNVGASESQLNGILLVIGAIGVGLALLTGSFIPLVVAAIAGLVVVFADTFGHGQELIDGLKLTLQGLIDFLVGIFTGDMDRAMQGITAIFDGVKAVILSLVDSIRDWLGSLIDNLIENADGRLKPFLMGVKDFVFAVFDAIRKTVSDVVDACQLIFKGIVDFIAGVFTGDWDRAWAGVANVFKGIVNIITSLFGNMVNLAIRGLNWLIGKIRQISFTVPEWVPGIGGKTAGFGWIQDIPEWQIPQLATGAVIPPNREFLAILGDQRNGTNIETPEGLLRQIMREELGGRGNTYQVNATANGRNLFRLVIDEAKGEQMRTGRNPFMLT